MEEEIVYTDKPKDRKRNRTAKEKIEYLNLSRKKKENVLRYGKTFKIPKKQPNPGVNSWLSSPKYRLLPSWQLDLIKRCKKYEGSKELIDIRMAVQAMSFIDIENPTRRDKILEQIDRFLDKILPRLNLNVNKTNENNYSLQIETFMKKNRETLINTNEEHENEEIKEEQKSEENEE